MACRELTVYRGRDAVNTDRSLLCGRVIPSSPFRERGRPVQHKVHTRDRRVLGRAVVLEQKSRAVQDVVAAGSAGL